MHVLATVIVRTMAEGAASVQVAPVDVRDPQVLALLDALTVELAGAGYSAAQTFGYSPEQLLRAGVRLVGARVAGQLVGVGGLELSGGGTAELKRFFVTREHRGTGVADALMAALLDFAAKHHVGVLRLETGDKQQAAVAFYRRHGFTEIPRFGPYLASETSVCMQRELAPRSGYPAA